jgi:two-component system sensor histidine kinase KdpD
VSGGRWRHWVLCRGDVATTGALLMVRDRLDKAHVALVYLLLVLAGSVAGGRPLGFALATTAFVLFNWFFLQPFNTLAIANPLDWLVLVAFLVVGAVAAQIVHRLREEADEAHHRAEEVDRLATLGAETLSVPLADDALAAIAEMIRSTLGWPPAESTGPGLRVRRATTPWHGSPGRFGPVTAGPPGSPTTPGSTNGSTWPWRFGCRSSRSGRSSGCPSWKPTGRSG